MITHVENSMLSRKLTTTGSIEKKSIDFVLFFKVNKIRTKTVQFVRIQSRPIYAPNALDWLTILGW